MTLPWYAIYARSRWEHRIAGALRQKGFEVFLPTYSTPASKRSGRNQAVLPPLFPGYLFCRIDIEHRLPVLVVPGVISILGVGQTPQPVPEHEMDAVRKMITSGLAVSPDAVLEPGQSVTVEQGPLKGVTGTLVTKMKESLLLVSISLLNRSVSVTLKPEWVSSSAVLQTLVASGQNQSYLQRAL